MMDKINKLKENLLKKGYDVKTFDDIDGTVEYLNNTIDQKTVGFGGSVTLHEIGIYPMLKKHNKVYWHEELEEDMTVMEARKKAAEAEIYLSSVNAISLNGEIVNIDNTGNRVAAMTFGPREVYLILGRNKICNDLNEAVDRARNIAAPLNAKRLNKKTPCAIKADKCYDCHSEERICRNLSIFWKRPLGLKYHIVIIDKDLGY